MGAVLRPALVLRDFPHGGTRSPIRLVVRAAVACRCRLFAITLGIIGSVWAYRVNKFAEPRVRIQTERGHVVSDTGPYAIVRHPIYVAGFLLVVGMPLALGSLWALIR